MNELVFPCMGTTVRLLADAPLEPLRAGHRGARRAADALRPEQRAVRAQRRPARGGARVAAAAARGPGGAARRAADRRARRSRRCSDALEAAGYARSRTGVEPAPLDAALRAAPAAPPGHARPALARGRGRRDDTIARPPGLRLDLGGSAKGLAADWAASQLRAALRRRLRRRHARRRHPRRRAVRGTGAHAPRSATAPSPPPASTGACGGAPTARTPTTCSTPARASPRGPALISATALAPTALEAEALAKAALLSGPRGARRLLAAGGGIVVRDDGCSEVVGRGAAASVGGGMTPRPDGLRLVAGQPRASGLVALALITLSVGARAWRWPAGRSGARAARAS